MIRAGVMGATGYTGLEVIRLLSRHPQAQVVFATARSQAGLRLPDVHPGAPDMALSDAADVRLADADVIFLCLPHGATQTAARSALDAGCVVIDLSADHRLHDPATYARWYGSAHAHPDLLGEAVYGLTEMRREAIREARLIGNPGCYPTSILLGLAPLLQSGLLSGATVIADSKSGASGAGRTPSVPLLFTEVNENARPYNVGHVHRHVAEIEQELSALADGPPPTGIVFSPHLLPVNRGIISTLYVPLSDGGADASVRSLYTERYAREPFVHVLPEGQTASLAHAVRTNRDVISLHPVPERGMLIVVSVIDNLLKGAAGQAVQNMNVRFGLDETAGLP
ncbi:MAG: N-acetyl-gamma-glutamyl-phosphate reductase [Proteobacteria bacterium]|nr:N-acetyl-gamma-glutamyl-phosphate reductase [Pseudomonadota bacterium]